MRPRVRKPADALLLEPAQRPPTPADTLRRISGRVLALPATGLSGDAGGIVAVSAVHAIGLLRIGGEGVSEQARRRAVALLDLAQLGQGEALGVGRRLEVPLDEGGELGLQGGSPLGIADPLG
jgi:hypothetical protein